jgi:hypothetical protein
VRIRIKQALWVGVLVISAGACQAQQKGQYVPGQYGLNAGVLPNPGITYANLTLNYSANKLANSDGSSLPLNGAYKIWAVENVFYYTPKTKVLGGRLAMMAAFPTLANGSLTLGSLNFPNVAVSGGGSGLADTWLQPVTLGWSGKRFDSFIGYAFMAPTGRYTPGASDNVGSGYWGNNFLANMTAYLTRNKATSANLSTNWEFHGSKDTGFGTSITPGRTFTMEWGVGQIVPLKKNFSQLLQIGVIGYDQWQVTENRGFLRPNIPANGLPFYSGHGIGFQTTYMLPGKGLNLVFKYDDEYRALASPQGRWIAFGGSYTFRIPKPAAPPKP